MSDLYNRQVEHTKNIGLLIGFAYASGYELTEGEAWRTPQQAQWNAAHGLGSAHSVHMDRLANDFNIFKDGQMCTTAEEVKPLADYWKTLSPDNCWGGDFTGKTAGDIGHFSQAYGGVK